MNATIALPVRLHADRLGVIASALCAVHCLVTPFFLVVLPTFGRIWSHPASHWGMALVVVPLATAMMAAGFRRHRRRWILATGILGIIGVLVGASIPYLENASGTPAASDSVNMAAAAEHGSDGATEEVGCTDSCCPSIVADDDGTSRLHIPLASIVTTFGGLALIISHLGNLCVCSNCRQSGCQAA